MKLCPKCKLELPRSEFSKSASKRDGLSSHCRSCRAVSSRKYREKKRESLSVKKKAYRSVPENMVRTRETNRLWERNNSDKVAGYKGSYYAKFPEKFKARSNLYYSVKVGKVIKSDLCECCGSGGKVEAHHSDYDKQLDVKWVCRACHDKIHSEALV